MDYIKNFAEILIKLREEKGVSQQELALALGITRQSLSLYESKERKINIELLAKIADYFNVTTDYLLGRTEVKSRNENIQLICDYTGLNELTVDYLNACYENSQDDIFVSLSTGYLFEREELGIEAITYTPSDFINDLVKFNANPPHSLFVITEMIRRLIYSTDDNLSYSDKIDIEGGRLFMCQKVLTELIQDICNSHKESKTNSVNKRNNVKAD